LQSEELRDGVLGIPMAAKTRSGHTAIERAEVRLITSGYFGIDRRRCDHPIPLVEVISGPRIHQWLVPQIPDFEVHCENRGAFPRTCRRRRVTVFEAPTSEDLETHPAFRNG